jgi:tRNA uridine 5-carboxymethylaminomethyl modification enzyme
MRWSLFWPRGPFLSGLVHIGFTLDACGRAGEFASYGLPAHLRELGFELGRMKTGTPPRLKKSSIDFSAFKPTESDDQTPALFCLSVAPVAPLPQMPSYIGHTNASQPRDRP